MFHITYNGNASGAAQAVEQQATAGKEEKEGAAKELKAQAIALALAAVAAQDPAAHISVMVYGASKCIDDSTTHTLRMEIGA